MFFFGKTSTTTITFEVDEYRLGDFNEALSILGISKEEAFDQFLSMLIREALRPQEKSELLPPANEKEGSSRLSQKTIESRILSWAAKPKSYPHMMVKAFLTASFNHGTETPYRDKICAFFTDYAGLSSSFKDPTFMSVFRQMCSNASRAYGDVFLYNRRERLVSLNPVYRDLILSLRDKFMDDNSFLWR